jgi:hypothetical protein
MSTTTPLRPGEAEFEPLPEEGAGVLVSPAEFVEPAEDPPVVPRGAARPTKRRSRLSRTWRLVRTAVFLVVLLDVALGSFGVIPGPASKPSVRSKHQSKAAAATVRSAGEAGTPAVPHPTTGPVAPPALLAFVRVKRLTLYVPTHQLRGIGYHEAATSDALSLTPLGRCVENANKGRMRTPKAVPGPDYVILKTRYRRKGPTTAVDVAMPKRATVVAPVSGTVVKVMAYTLYKYWLDFRIEIRPAGSPRLRVVMIHLTDLRVHRGSVLVAGVTPIGHPRVFGFRSDINDYVGEGVPHVHVEVKEIGPPGRKA